MGTLSNTSRVCTECGAKNPDDYRFCFSCGSALPERAEAPPHQTETPVRAVVICRKCQATNPDEYLYCKQCGTRLRRRPEPKKAFVIPLVVGAIGGIVGAVYRYYRGALPIRVGFAAVGDAGMWWAVAAFITWLVRPSWRRAVALGAAVLLTAIVFGGYMLVQYSTGNYLGYVQLPTTESPSPTVIVVTATSSISQVPVPRATPTAPLGSLEYYRQRAGLGSATATAQPASVQSVVQELDRLRVGPTPEPGTLDYYRRRFGLGPEKDLAGRCVYWMDAAQYVGKEVCICGTVHHIQNKNGTGYIHFDDASDAFYGFKLGWEWYEDVLDGRCVLICGVVETNYGRPRILIDDPEKQLLWCP